MAHRSVSAATRENWRRPAANEFAAAKQAHRPGIRDEQTARPAFATRAQAQLLDALGWQVVASPRREVERHAPLQCCFVLRDGRREEAVFGYTSLTAPLAMNASALRKAQLQIEGFLAALGEDRGVLLQNMPLFSFGGRRQDRIVVFGGWRFHRGVWKPFVLGPDGLAGVAAQDTLFARGTAPHHMAEVYGHSAKAVMPWIAGVVRAIESLGSRDAGADQAAVTGPGADGLQVMPGPSGWFRARICHASGITPARQACSDTPPLGNADAAVARTFWNSGADEFQFHLLGVDRR